MNVSSEIATFLAPHRHLSGVDFCLPRFAGNQSSPLHLMGSEDFDYPSTALAERDARSAMHVISLLSCVTGMANEVSFRAPEEFAASDCGDHVRVLFGSRSNHALASIFDESRLGELVRFEFSDNWTIIGKDGARFSIRDPSTLDRQKYELSTDYAVVARGSDKKHRTVFVVAGLGGRATEGGGLFLKNSWRPLQSRFGDADFAVVLEFPPPIKPTECKVVAQYSRPPAFV